MGAGVATVGRRPYAVGLYWENSPSGRVSQAAKEAARQPGQQAEFYAVRAGNKGGRTPQFGLSPTGVGHKIGMPVFAACLSNQQPGSWAGAFLLCDDTVNGLYLLLGAPSRSRSIYGAKKCFLGLDRPLFRMR